MDLMIKNFIGGPIFKFESFSPYIYSKILVEEICANFFPCVVNLVPEKFKSSASKKFKFPSLILLNIIFE